MIGKFFTFIGNIARGLGLVIGSAVGFIAYGLFGYFILWCIKSFSMLMINYEWITNEYVVDFYDFIFVQNITYTELVVAIGFGLAGVFKVLDGKRE
jgi:hypothetical protein